MSETSTLAHTPLNELHHRLDAKMVGFAGYRMPVQYPLGVLKEHKHTRAAAGLFDVSHMGQVMLTAKSGDTADAALALERLVCADIAGLKRGRQRYALFTNDEGGILDDLMVANLGDRLYIVVNAACKEDDIAHMQSHLSADCEVVPAEDRALLALQGPEAAAALGRIGADVSDMRFMEVRETDVAGSAAIVARAGYTGEDGFEISLPADAAPGLAEALLADDAVEPIGLGARDSLRLEAGLCLYGNDIDTGTTPIEAALDWAIGKARRSGGDRAGGFPGSDRILAQLSGGPERLRVGLKPEGRAPIREGVKLFAGEDGDDPIGAVTSGGFGPSVDGPVAMGYVPADLADPGSLVYAEVRGKRLPVRVSDLPFITPGYKR